MRYFYRHSSSGELDETRQFLVRHFHRHSNMVVVEDGMARDCSL